MRSVKIRAVSSNHIFFVFHRCTPSNLLCLQIKIRKGLDPGDVLLAPSHHHIKHMLQLFAFLRQGVGITHRALLIRSPHKNSCFFQSFQTIGQKVGWDFLRRFEQLVEGGPATQQIAHDEERPFVSGDIEQIGDRAR